MWDGDLSYSFVLSGCLRVAGDLQADLRMLLGGELRGYVRVC